jgi:GT2 family glycosyltransferase
VLVVIVSADDAHWLKSCLVSLAQGTWRSLHVLVVAICCHDDTIEVAEKAGVPVTVVQTTRRMGFAGSNNIGFQMAVDEGYDYIYLLNADTVVHPNAIEMLVNFLETDDRYAIAGNLQIDYDSADWDTLNEWSRIVLAEASSLGASEKRSGTTRILDHYYVQGAAMMVRTSITACIGMLDPVYGSFYEETDLCRRCRLSGRGVCLVLDSKVKHFGGGNWKRNRARNIERDYLYLRNQFLFFLSLPQPISTRMRIAIKLIYEHVTKLRYRLDHTRMPLWRYPLVVFAALYRLPQMGTLIRRNRLIAGGNERLPSNLMAIGRE